MRSKLDRNVARKGLITRYFLRRLAQAQHEGSSRHSRAYTRALAEVIAVFILMPGIALFSAAAWYFSSMPPGRWLVDANARATLGAVMLVTFGLVLIGHVLIGHHFRRYRRNPEAASEFDTEEDRQIAFWQKFFVTAICGVMAPLATLINITRF